MLKVLKTQSVTASWASAWTLEFFTKRHQNQQKPLMTTARRCVSRDRVGAKREAAQPYAGCLPVETMIAIAGTPRATMVVSPEINRLKHSNATWKNDVIMMTCAGSVDILELTLRGMVN